MTIQRQIFEGREALTEATRLLQRVRNTSATFGVWEAADIQWNWRKPRKSDHSQKVFWFDDDGPVASVWVTKSGKTSWQLDPIMVQGTIDPNELWQAVLDEISAHPQRSWEIPVDDQDHELIRFLTSHGFTPADSDSTAWMTAGECPTISPLAEGFRIVDRVSRHDQPHPMLDRNGEDLAERLEQCSLYDPALDLAIETEDGSIAGYSMYWYDPETRVGLVEPVRVHDAYQRRGLARAMVSVGLNRLVEAGAERLKVSYETEAAGALYLGLGFVKQSTTTWYTVPRK